MSNAVATSENGKILSSRMITAFYESYWCNIDDDGDKDNHNNDGNNDDDINIKNGNVNDNDNKNHNDDNSRDEILLLLICDEIFFKDTFYLFACTCILGCHLHFTV